MMENYKELFLQEAEQHRENIDQILLKLEKEPKKELIEELFRAFHTLKGMAATMNYTAVQQLCHALEEVLDKLRKGEQKVNKDLIEVSFHCVDALSQLLKEIKTGKEVLDISPYIKELQALSLPQVLKKKDTEEAKLFIEHESLNEVESLPKVESINVPVERLDTLLHLTEELLVNRLQLQQTKNRFQDEELNSQLTYFERLSDDLQFHVIQARMMPISYVFNRFPRMVRDLAMSEGKEVNLVTEGGDIELDRTIIDQIGEPLVHLIRNACDHGLELPTERQKKHKEKTGTLTLKARREKGLVIIEVEDDGAGIDKEKVQAAAVKKGLIKLTKPLPEEELWQLLLKHSLSTTQQATLVSGRGIGLNVVAKNVEAFGGKVLIHSEKGKGTKFSLYLPLTLAIIKALIVKVGNNVYAIPVQDVLRSVQVKRSSVIKEKEQKHFYLGKDKIRLIKLQELFHQEEPSRQEKVLAVLVEKEGRTAGLVVDSLINELDIIVKPLSSLLRENRQFSGATILGDGRATLIIDVENIIRQQATEQELTEQGV